MASVGPIFDTALARLAIVFMILLFLNRKLPLYFCLLISSLLMGLWMGMNFQSIIGVLLTEVMKPSTLILSLVIVLIVLFSGLLKMSGSLDSIVSSMKGLSTRPGLSLALAPALIGFLPMPGGAVFSAPMVESAVGDLKVTSESKLAINYWFRHIPEFIWPLYPGFILSLSIFGLEAWKLTVYQSPLSLGAALAGVLFVLPSFSGRRYRNDGVSENPWKDFFIQLAPIIMVLALMFGLQGGAEIYGLRTGKTVPLTQHISMTVGLITGIIYLKKAYDIDFRTICSITYRSGAFNIVLMVFGIMAFKGILDQSQAISQIKTELQAFEISEVYVIALLPLIAGLITGIAVGFVGSSFPLVATLAPANENIIPYVVLAYGFGFLGMMLSPVHLCFLVTQEYFHTNAIDSYKQLWKPAVFFTLWIIIVFLLYRLVV